jgi:hypothetical protein
LFLALTRARAFAAPPHQLAKEAQVAASQVS